MTAIELLESLNALDEHERIEAKRGQEIGPSILETVCSFSNEPRMGGGHILLGVTKEEQALFPAYEAVGVAQVDKLINDLASQCRTVFNTPISVEIQQEKLGDKTVVVVFVPEAPASRKPIFFRSQGLPRGAYRRIGSSDQRCTEDDVAILYQNRNVESFDSTIIADAAMEDISIDAVDDYRQTLREESPDAEALRWTHDELLRALHCVKRDASGVLKPTVAGIQLFGTQMALRRLFPTVRVDYIRVPGKEWLADPERRFDAVEMRDPLFRLIRRAQAAVMDDLPKAFNLPEGELQRKDIPLIPRDVIREAIVNAVMHRDYRSHGTVQIIRYANRLEIRNPGFSLKSMEHLGEPKSEPRNPRIAAVLHETHFAETKGTGIGTMRRLMQDAGLEPPFFESDRANDDFSVRFYFQHFLNEDSIAWLSRFKELQLSNDEARALIAAREQGAINNAMYRSLNKVDTLAASQALRRLRDAGLLTQHDKGTATRYEPTEKLLGGGQAAGADGLSGKSAAVSSNPEALSGKPGPLSSMPEGLSSMAGGLSSMAGTPFPAGELPTDAHLQSLPSGLQIRRATLPAEVRAQLSAIGERSSPAEVREVILSLCLNGEWTSAEFAALLRRKTKYLVQNYLRPMLTEGLIEHTIPDQPRHPQQAYRIATGAL